MAVAEFGNMLMRFGEMKAMALELIQLIDQEQASD